VVRSGGGAGPRGGGGGRGRGGGRAHGYNCYLDIRVEELQKMSNKPQHDGTPTRFVISTSNTNPALAAAPNRCATESYIRNSHHSI
jgi:hypothetical protein